MHPIQISPVAGTPAWFNAANGLRATLFALCLSLIHGCATHTPISDAPVANPQAVWTQRLATLSSANDWLLKGRLSVRKDKDGFSAGIRWRQEGEHYTIELYDPLGRKTAVLEGTRKGAALTTSKGQREHAEDAELLMRKLLGWSAPVSSLRYWVLGIPSPTGAAPSAQALDSQGRLASLKQANWKIEYPRYRQENAPQLPELILASGQALEIKLLIKEWQLFDAR